MECKGWHSDALRRNPRATDSQGVIRTMREGMLGEFGLAILNHGRPRGPGTDVAWFPVMGTPSDFGPGAFCFPASADLKNNVVTAKRVRTVGAVLSMVANFQGVI